MKRTRRRTGGQVTGISVITSTNRPHFMEHMFRNYQRQRWGKKEWVIVVNKSNVNMARYRRMASRLKNVRVFQLPGSASLGRCLNYAAARTKYPIISKMDDDEYYAPLYLKSLMRGFRRSGADVVGKRSIFIYLHGSRMLLRRFYPTNRFVGMLAGGTITFKRHVWQKVKFANRTHGEDVVFNRACRRKGFRLYAVGPYNFCALRRKNSNSHTWKVSDRQFIAHPQTKIIMRGTNYKRHVIKPI